MATHGLRLLSSLFCESPTVWAEVQCYDRCWTCLLSQSPFHQSYGPMSQVLTFTPDFNLEGGNMKKQHLITCEGLDGNGLWFLDVSSPLGENVMSGNPLIHGWNLRERDEFEPEKVLAEPIGLPWCWASTFPRIWQQLHTHGRQRRPLLVEPHHKTHIAGQKYLPETGSKNPIPSTLLTLLGLLPQAILIFGI